MTATDPTRCMCGAPASVHLVLRASDPANACVFVVPSCDWHAEGAAAYLWSVDVRAAFVRASGLVCGDEIELTCEGLEVVNG